MPLWSANDWMGMPLDKEAAQRNLEDAGYVVTGWSCGKPDIDGDVDNWEEIQELCLGNVSPPEDKPKKKPSRRRAK